MISTNSETMFLPSINFPLLGSTINEKSLFSADLAVIPPLTAERLTVIDASGSFSHKIPTLLFPFEDKRKRKLKELNRITETVLEFRNLEQGWDGYDGTSASLKSVVYAINFLQNLNQEGIPFPQPTLSGEGEISFYWSSGNSYLDIVIGENGTYSYYAEKDNKGFGDDDLEIDDGLPEKLEAHLRINL